MTRPQSFVTDQNLQRALDPSLVPADGYAGLDTFYFASLGADSIPTIVAALDRLEPASRAQLSIMLERRASDLREEAAKLGWPSWNYSRQRALESLTAAGF